MHKPALRHFRIAVLPLQVSLVNATPIAIDQGTSSGYVTSDNLGCSTNGQRALTEYRVTRQPAGGRLYLNERAASAFTQVNVDNREVTFVQTDMTLENDSFVCTISNQVWREAGNCFDKRKLFFMRFHSTYRHGSGEVKTLSCRGVGVKKIGRTRVQV